MYYILYIIVGCSGGGGQWCGWAGGVEQTDRGGQQGTPLTFCIAFILCWLMLQSIDVDIIDITQRKKSIIKSYTYSYEECNCIKK